MINQKSRLLVLYPPFVLALKKTGEEKYSLIGGNIETNETPIESIIREAKEEAGINLTENDLAFNDKYTEAKQGVVHERNYFYLNDINQKFKVNEPEKFESIEWVDFFENKKKFKKLDQKAIVNQFILMG